MSKIIAIMIIIIPVVSFIVNLSEAYENGKQCTKYKWERKVLK